MNAEEYERMYRLEESYWWFLGRHDLVLRFVQQLYRGRTDLTILDIGCGTGAMSAHLAQHGQVVSADFSPLALSFSSRRGMKRLCQADAGRLPYRDGAFDLVVALDILEHLPDDGSAARELRRVLRPGGRLIATVPAYRSLWSGHDVALMHQRRYRASEVRGLLSGAGLRVERLSYAMTFLFPIAWLVRRVTARRAGRPEATLVPVPRAVNAALTGVLSVENAVIQHASLPFGLTVLCVARRPEH